MNQAKATPLQSVTMAVSNQGVNNLFKFILPELLGQTFTAPTMPALSSPVEIPSTDQTIYVDKINLSGGNISDIKIPATPAISYSTSGIPAISLIGGFHVHYDTWFEAGSVSSDPGGDSPDYSQYAHDMGAFDFDVTNINMSFNVSITGGTPTSQLLWKVQVTNPQQSNVSVANVAIPGGSELHGSDLSCVTSRVQTFVDAKVADVHFANDLAKALNGVLATIPSSGQLTPTILYQFSPSCDPTYPEEAGILLGITGGVQYNNSSYSASPVNIPLPTIDPSLDIVLNVSAYEFSALLWAAFQNDDLSINLIPKSDSGSETLTSNYYSVIWPELYAFGLTKNSNGVPLQIIAAAATAPTVSIGAALQLTGAVYASLQSQIDTTDYVDLGNMENIIYYSSGEFNAALTNYLTPAAVTKYGAIILSAVQAAAAPVTLSVPLAINVAINFMYQGSWTQILTFTINRSNVLSNLSLNNPTGIADILGFTFSQQNADTITDVKFIVSSLDTTLTDTLDVVWALFSANLNTAINSVGTRGLPLPTINQLCLGSPAIALCADSGGYLTLAANIQQA